VKGRCRGSEAEHGRRVRPRFGGRRFHWGRVMGGGHAKKGGEMGIREGGTAGAEGGSCSGRGACWLTVGGRGEQIRRAGDKNAALGAGPRTGGGI